MRTIIQISELNYSCIATVTFAHKSKITLQTPSTGGESAATHAILLSPLNCFAHSVIHCCTSPSFNLHLQSNLSLCFSVSSGTHPAVVALSIASLRVNEMKALATYTCAWAARKTLSTPSFSLSLALSTPFSMPSTLEKNMQVAPITFTNVILFSLHETLLQVACVSFSLSFLDSKTIVTGPSFWMSICE